MTTITAEAIEELRRLASEAAPGDFWIVLVDHIDQLTARNAELAGELKKANEYAEKFERDMYLEMNRAEAAEAELARRDALEPVKRVNALQMHLVCLEANRSLDKYTAMAKEVNKILGSGPAPAPVVKEDEDGVAVGFASWYERRFAFYTYKGSSHVSECEDAYRAGWLKGGAE